MFSGFRHLTLVKPMVVLDLEATGTDVLHARIVELAAIRCEPGGRTVRRRQLVNPTVPIPREAAAVHGITDDRVASSPTFEEIAPKVLDLIGDADLCGYNAAKFDVRVLLAELDRCGLSLPMERRAVVDPLEVFVMMYPRNLNAAVKTYVGEVAAAGHAAAAHGALADAEAAAAVLDAQLCAHPDLPRTAAGLARVSGRLDGTGLFRLVDGIVTFAFGKHRGRPLVEIAETDRSYLLWMCAIDFPDDALAYVKAALGRD